MCAYLHCSWLAFPKACQQGWSEKVLDKEKRRRRGRSRRRRRKKEKAGKEKRETTKEMVEMKKKRGRRREDQVRVYISKAGSNTKCR